MLPGNHLTESLLWVAGHLKRTISASVLTEAPNQQVEAGALYLYNGVKYQVTYSGFAKELSNSSCVTFESTHLQKNEKVAVRECTWKNRASIEAFSLISPPTLSTLTPS